MQAGKGETTVGYAVHVPLLDRAQGSAPFGITRGRVQEFCEASGKEPGAKQISGPSTLVPATLPAVQPLQLTLALEKFQRQ